MYRLLLKSVQATASFRDADIYICTYGVVMTRPTNTTTNSTSSLYTHAGNISSLSSRAQKKKKQKP